VVMSFRQQQVKREKKKSFYLRELSAILSRLVPDQPTLMPLYFTRIELSADGGQCYVYCAFMNASAAEDGEKLFEEARKILVLYRGSMRTALAGTLSGRYVPDLRFVFDANKEKEQRVTDLLGKVSQELSEYDAQRDGVDSKKE